MGFPSPAKAGEGLGVRAGKLGIMPTAQKGQHSGQRWRTSATIQERARQLRQEQTPAEAKLWQALRDRRFKDYKFRRQHPIGRFIIDFFCPELSFVIEVDGAVHRNQDQVCRDEERTAMLQNMVYRVYRLTNEQVETNLSAALDGLYQMLSEVASTSAKTSPLPLWRERG